MPQIGQDIRKGVILEWYVKEGDKIEKGDIIASVESDKAVFEVEAFESGTIIKILHKAGEEAEVFKPIAFIGEPGENIKEAVPEQEPEAAEKWTSQTNAMPSADHSVPDEKIFASPTVRRIAREYNLDLSEIKGSGPDGRIIKRDLQQFISGNRAAGTMVQADEADLIVPFSQMRKSIAARLQNSKQNIPHYYLYRQMNAGKTLAMREEYNKKNRVHVSINDLIIYCVARSLKQFPKLNAHVEEDRFIIKREINIGIAVSVEDGLLVPVIHNVDQKSLLEISRISREIIQKAQNGKIAGGMTGTFTVSNLGMYGISHFQAIINPPECAILSVGGIEKKILPAGNGNPFSDSITIGLACDHRVIDGVYGAQFLDYLSGIFENLNIQQTNGSINI